MIRAFVATPVGEMLALASDVGLCALEFTGPGRMERLDTRVERFFDHPAIIDGDAPAIRAARRWLDAYFAGDDPSALDVPMDMRGAAFELRVWACLRRIPPGATSTYGAIAKEIGSPGAARAVGMANGANPVAIIVPCHRVIGASGSLTGYGGGLDRKRWLLNHEARWRQSLF